MKKGFLWNIVHEFPIFTIFKYNGKYFIDSESLGEIVLYHSNGVSKIDKDFESWACSDKRMPDDFENYIRDAL